MSDTLPTTGSSDLPAAGLRWTDNHCHLGWAEAQHLGGQNDGQVGATAKTDSTDIPTTSTDTPTTNDPSKWPDLVDVSATAGFDEAVAASLDAAKAEGVERFVNVGTDLATSKRAIAVAAAHPEVWATVGVHPHDAEGGLAGIEELLGQPRVVAVGEAGLDYHYDNSPRTEQRAVFAAQIGLAHQHGMPLVIHSRSAWDDTFAMLDSEGLPPHTVFHCFTGGAPEAEKALERGATLSFSGIVTFKSAEELRDAARLCPVDRLMVETDSPYLAPVPNRGKANEPGWVPLVGAGVAAAKGIDVAEVAEASWNTADAFYGLSDQGGQ